MTDPAGQVWQDLPAPEPPLLPVHVASRLETLRRTTDIPTGDPIHVVSPATLQALWGYFAQDRGRERLALLLGTVWRISGRSSLLVAVSEFMGVAGAQSSAVRVSMSARHWPAVWSRMGEKQVIGWAHSHPGLGVLPSSTDLATQANWFSQPWALALIFDPWTGASAAYAGAHSRPADLCESAEIMALVL